MDLITHSIFYVLKLYKISDILIPVSVPVDFIQADSTVVPSLNHVDISIDLLHESSL